MGVWGFTVGLNWRVLEDSDGSQYYWDGNQGFLKGQIAVLSGSDGAKVLLTVLNGLDCHGRSEFHRVVESTIWQGLPSPDIFYGDSRHIIYIYTYSK